MFKLLQLYACQQDTAIVISVVIITTLQHVILRHINVIIQLYDMAIVISVVIMTTLWPAQC